MRTYRLYISSILLLGIFAIVACKKEQIEFREDLPEVSVCLRMQLNLKGADNRQTKAPEDVLPGTSDETKITTLTVFVIDLDNSDNLNWNKVKHVTQTVNSTASQFNLDISLRVSSGRKHIYVGANMNSAQIESIRSNRGIYTSSGATYANVIGDFVDLNGRGVVMFGQMLISNNPIIEITGPVGAATPIMTQVEMSRVVSKVALTYKTTTPGDEFVKIAAGIDGFIKANSVCFMLNNTSKSIDFVAGISGSHFRYSINDYLAFNTGSSSTLLYHYKTDPTPHFMYYTPEAAVFGESVQYTTAEIKLPFDMTPGDTPYYEGVEEYVGVIAGQHKHYNSSLYCLESTVSKAGFLPQDKVLDVRHGINTKVVVAARYTPKYVWHYDIGTGLVPEMITTEAGMAAITGNAGDLNGVGTFYAVLKDASQTPPIYEYYTYDAKRYLEQNPPVGGVPHFITYKRGYGYYTTFISQPTIGVDQDEHYILRRNNYYILSIKEFNPPGAVYPQDIYMQVNSETTNWIPGKTTTVTVE